jgi:hypothetical protein
MVEIRLAERMRFLDAETGSPEHGDEAAQTPRMIPSPAARMTAAISSRCGGSAGERTALVARGPPALNSPEVHCSVEEERDGR